MKTTDLKYSETISEFLKQMDQMQKDYDWALQEEDRLEKLTQDYLHMLELTELSYRDRARIAKYIKECRIERRNAKDVIATAAPVVDFLNSEKGKELIGQLQQTLGRVRKAENNIEIRTYMPRVLSKEQFDSRMSDSYVAGD